MVTEHRRNDDGGDDPEEQEDVPIQNALLRPRSRTSLPASTRTVEATLTALPP